MPLRGEGSRAMFSGVFQHSIDAKGRTSLPARFRELLSAQGAGMGRGPEGGARARDAAGPGEAAERASVDERASTMADKSLRNGAVLALKPAAVQRVARWEESVATVTVRGELDREALWAID